MPGPSLTTWACDDMDAPTHSLQHLETSVKGVRNAMAGGFARGIKISKLDLKSSIEDFRVTLESGTRGEGGEKGWAMYGDILRVAATALEKAKAREPRK
jgi:hypothetical protein